MCGPHTFSEAVHIRVGMYGPLCSFQANRMGMCLGLLTHIPLTSLVTMGMNGYFEFHDMWDCMSLLVHTSYLTPSLVMY